MSKYSSVPSYSKRSASRLSTADPRLQSIFNELILTFDNSIICGYRNKADQNAAYAASNSQVQWPDGKHNENPSRAIDAVPYPTMWDDKKAFYFMAGKIDEIARKRGIRIRWGGDWDRDYDFDDQKFMDLGHWELVD